MARAGNASNAAALSADSEKESSAEKTAAAKTDSVKTAEKKEKDISDTDKVRIKNPLLCGKKVVGLDRENPLSFDGNGIAETDGKNAKYFLTVPGYELVK